VSSVSVSSVSVSSVSVSSVSVSSVSVSSVSVSSVSDFIDQISYEKPFFVTLQPISDYKEPSGISTPTATEKTDMTKSVPISEKGNSDGKASLFSFNFNPNSSVEKSSPKFNRPISFQTGSGFQSKGFDFGVTEISKASIPELKSTVGEEPFGGSFKGHSNFILDIALSQDHLYSSRQLRSGI
jgi:hypothetical protein